jgi:hypothetical protein
VGSNVGVRLPSGGLGCCHVEWSLASGLLVSLLVSQSFSLKPLLGVADVVFLVCELHWWRGSSSLGRSMAPNADPIQVIR